MIAAPGRIFTQCPSKHNAALGMRPEHRHMDSQPRHAAAQVTLLEASFVFLPGLRRGENPSSEQHRQALKCCCRFASSSAEETDRIPVADQRSFASSSAEETDRIPVADQRSCAQRQQQRRAALCKLASSFKANIDPQPPSTVVLQARAQLRKRSLQDVNNTNARATVSHLLWLCSRPVSTAAE